MFGPTGGGMWPPGAPAGSSAAAAAAAASLYNNSLYPGGLGAPGQAPHHMAHLPSGHPYGPPGQQSAASLIQRQLGQAAHAHMLASGGGRGGSMMPPMLPPSSNNMRMVELQEKRKQEAEKRRRAEEERQKAAKASEELFTSSGLFDEPQKIHVQDDTVCQISKIHAEYLAGILVCLRFQGFVSLVKTSADNANSQFLTFSPMN